MNMHDEQFTPQEVDEQVEQFLQQGSSLRRASSANAQLVRSLSSISKDDAARLERIRTRLAERTSGAIMNISPLSVEDYQHRHTDPMLGASVGRSVPQRRSRSRLVAVLASLVAVLVIASSVAAYALASRSVPPNNTSVGSRQPASVAYASSAPSQKIEVSGGGQIYPDKRYVVAFSISARVTGILVKAGDTVKKGDRLIQLDMAQLNASLLPAQANLADAQNRLIAAEHLDQLAAIAAAQAQLSSAYAQLEALEAKLNDGAFIQNGSLVAIGGGVVSEIDVSVGQTYQSNQTLMVVQDESNLTVHAKLPAAYSKKVAVGQTAVVTVASLPNINISGKVVSILPPAGSKSDTFEVWVSFNNNLINPKLVPGMTAFVQIQEP